MLVYCAKMKKEMISLCRRGKCGKKLPVSEILIWKQSPFYAG